MDGCITYDTIHKKYRVYFKTKRVRVWSLFDELTEAIVFKDMLVKVYDSV